MRSLRYLAVALIVALAATGIAIAANPGATTKQVAASFTTTSMQPVNTKTCTGADGTYVVTDAMYTGTATGTLTEGATDALMIHARTIVNQTTGDGTATGQFSIKNGHTPVANGQLNAVVSGSSSLNGLLLGHGPGGPPPPPPPPPRGQHLIANFTATLSAGGISGEIGGNGSMIATAVSQSGSCPPPPPPNPHKHPYHAHVHPAAPHPGPPHPEPSHKPGHH